MKEKEIIKRCQNGDKTAFDALIRLFYPYVSGYLLKITIDQDLTEDLTQETFLKAIRSIDSYDLNGKAGFGTYIITIAKNCYIDYCRKNKAVFLDISDIECSTNQDLEEELMKKLAYEEVLTYINHLPPKQQKVLKLKYIDELTLKEIACITGVPEKTVKSRIHEGTKKLRKWLTFWKEGSFYGKD